MSGGVDSSVAAALLKERGYDVIGIHMRCYNVDGCAEEDAEDARRAAETLQIPFYTFDFEEEYKRKVVEYMVRGYRKGITPNPDVMCNREIKFGLFLKKSLALGADYIATGHYVRLRRTGRLSLFAARDKNKDQSYFLWTLTQKELKHCLFPIGEYTKPQVRELAKKFGLPNAEKKDSQGICFLGKVTLADFLKKYIPARRGAIITADGRKIGSHQGAAYYTIGQRHGLGIGGGMPLYVAEKNVRSNTLTVAEGEDNSSLYCGAVDLLQVNFISDLTNKKRKSKIPVYARVRYRQPLAQAVLIQKQKAKGKKQNYSLIFKQPQKFVAKGQSAVFYRRSPSASSGSKSKDFEMLGGGVIA